MKKVFTLVLLCLMLGTAVIAQDEPSAIPATAETTATVDATPSSLFGFNVGSLMASILALQNDEPSLLDLQLGYQHAYGHHWGLDLGFDYATNDPAGSAYYTTGITALSVSAGPVFFFKEEGVSGLFLRARGALILTKTTHLGSSTTGLNLGADAHIGYNIVFRPLLATGATRSSFGPFIGFQTSSAISGFCWGLNISFCF